MKKLNWDNGIQEFETNGGAVLRFNPSDPAFYNRFLSLIEKIKKVEDNLSREDQNVDGKQAIHLLCKYDQMIKAMLSETFGNQNDFELIFSSVNLMALGKNGKRVIVNFLDAVAPIIDDGAKKNAQATAAEAVERARLNREKRGTLK